MDEDLSCNVCIVGCGIAGSVLAYNLDPRISVIAIERKPLNSLGEDPCGNAVHKSWFDEDWIKPKPADFGAVASVTDSVRLNFPNEALEARLDQGREGIVLNKGDYVKGSLNRAIEDGVKLIQGVARPVLKYGKVNYINVDGRRVESDIYVDASGPAAVIRSNFFSLPQDALFKGYREIIECDHDIHAWQIYQFDRVSAYWAFPFERGLNLGGVAFGGDPDLKEGVEKVKEMWDWVDAKVNHSGYGWIISYKPIGLVYENLVAIGDAGVTVNPVTGGGIGPSVKAASLLAHYINSGESLEKFQKRYMKEIAGNYEKLYYSSRIMHNLQKFSWKRIAKWAFRKFYNGRPLEGSRIANY